MEYGAQPTTIAFAEPPPAARPALQPQSPGKVHIEQDWRRPRILDRAKGSSAKAVASRWTDPIPHTRERTAETHAGYCTVAMALSGTRMTFSIAGRSVHAGHVSPGMLQVNGPALPIRGTFFAPCDFLHLHFSTRFLAQCCEEAGGACSEKAAFVNSPFFRDAAVEQLGHALLAAAAHTGTHGRLYVDGIALAMAARLLSSHSTCSLPAPKTAVAALPGWRLRRVSDYIAAHLSEPIRLADLAASAGLTRMHFAAQFRVATGLRPHEYLLRRRIECARDMLSTSSLPVVEIALSVGFQTQAHFTTVFKRFVNETPYQWRNSNRTSRRDSAQTAVSSSAFAAFRSVVANPSVKRA
jgi:AraC family transcriptional regulator